MNIKKLMKNLIKFLLFALTGYLVIVLLLFLFLVGGADFMVYPWEKTDRWVCQEPHMEIEFHGESSYLDQDGNLLPITVGLLSNTFTVYLQSDDHFLHEENILLSGKWKIVKNTMVFTIEDDRIFDGAYSKLIFTPQ